MPMNVPGAARQVFEDRGEQLDASQILLVGGSIAAGQTYNNQLYGQSMAQDNITATPSGTQGNSVLVTGPIIRLSTVATLNDSITLPPGIRGMEIAVINSGAASAKVWPALGEQINGAGANVGFTPVTNTTPVIFICSSNGSWWTK